MLARAPWPQISEFEFCSFPFGFLAQQGAGPPTKARAVMSTSGWNGVDSVNLVMGSPIGVLQATHYLFVISLGRFCLILEIYMTHICLCVLFVVQL